MSDLGDAPRQPVIGMFAPDVGLEGRGQNALLQR